MKNHKNHTTLIKLLYSFHKIFIQLSYNFYTTFVQFLYNFCTTFGLPIIPPNFLRSFEFQCFRQIPPDKNKYNILVFLKLIIHIPTFIFRLKMACTTKKLLAHINHRKTFCRLGLILSIQPFNTRPLLYLKYSVSSNNLTQHYVSHGFCALQKVCNITISPDYPYGSLHHNICNPV